MPLVSALRRQKQADVFDFEDTLVYIEWSQKEKKGRKERKTNKEKKEKENKEETVEKEIVTKCMPYFIDYLPQ